MRKISDLILSVFRYIPQYFFLYLLLFIPIVVSGGNGFVDSIPFYVKNNKGTLVGGFHNRNSFLGTVPVKVYGARVGLDYGRRIGVFIGYYTTYNVADRYSYKEVKPSVFDTIVRYTNLSYLSVGGNYVFHTYKRFSFDLPIMVGFGAGFRHTNINHVPQGKELIFVLPIEAGLGVSYSLVDWLEIDSNIGLRITPLNAYEFTSSYYSFGLNIRFGYIYRKLKKQILQRKN